MTTFQSALEYSIMTFFIRKDLNRWCRVVLTGLGIGTLLVFNGCHDDKPLSHSDIQIDEPPPAVDLPSRKSGAEIVFGSKYHSLAKSLGASGPLGGAASKITDPVQVKDEQYYAEADLYIALIIIKQELDLGVIKPDLQRWLDDMRMKLSQKVKLPNQRSGRIQEVIQILQEGLDAKKTVERFEANGVNLDALSWSLGRMDLERQLKNRADLAQILPSTETPWSRNRSLKEEILDYADTYRASPRQVMRERFDRARQEIARMSDLMGIGVKPIPSAFSPTRSGDPVGPYPNTPSIVKPLPVTRP
jgi:hypothetical protein